MKKLPLIPVHESCDLVTSVIEERTWYFLVQEDALSDVLEFGVYGAILFESIETAAFCRDQIDPDAFILQVSHEFIAEESLYTPGDVCQMNWMEGLRRHQCLLYQNLVHPGALQIVDETSSIQETIVLIEGVRAKQASNMRLKRIVRDALNKSKTFKTAVKSISIKGNKMTVKLDKSVYLFEIDRDAEGWVQKIKFLAPKGRSQEVSIIRNAVARSFKSANFQQVLEDAASTDPPRLVMLDYTRLDGGRRTRLSEPYSYRFNPNKDRWYYYGWNVEEGGIRSYILDHIKGARITDIPFRPRFFVEIGQPKKGDPSMNQSGEYPAVVTKAQVKRAHKKFDLKGGYGKIIKRLGHSVPTSKQQAQNRAQQKAVLAKQARIKKIKKRAKRTLNKKPRITLKRR